MKVGQIVFIVSAFVAFSIVICLPRQGWLSLVWFQESRQLDHGMNTKRALKTKSERMGSLIIAAWSDYANAAAKIHEQHRDGNFTRTDFRTVYETLIANGLEFQAIQFVPRISHEERTAYEEEARAFYAVHYPHVDYRGFTGFENNLSTSVGYRSEQPFYYPIHYVEPIKGNEASIDFDYHASGHFKQTLVYCINNGMPALTDRLRLVSQQEEAPFGVVLMHPGDEFAATTEDREWPWDIAAVVVPIFALFRRFIEQQEQKQGGGDVFLFDKSDSSGTPLFLGAVRITPQTLYSGKPELQFLPKKELEELNLQGFQQHDIQMNNKVWTVVASVGCNLSGISTSAVIGIMICTTIMMF